METSKDTSERTGENKVVDFVSACRGGQAMPTSNLAENVSSSFVTPLTQPLNLVQKVTDANITRQVPSLKFAKTEFEEYIESQKESHAQEVTATRPAQEETTTSAAQEVATTSTAREAATASTDQEVATTSTAKEVATSSPTQEVENTSTAREVATNSSTQNVPTSTAAQNAPTSTAAQNDPTSASAQNEPTSASAQNEPTATSAQNAPTSVAAQNGSTVSPAHNAPSAAVSPQVPIVGLGERLPIAVVTPQAATANSGDQEAITLAVKPQEQASNPAAKEPAVSPLQKVPTTADTPQVPATSCAPTVPMAERSDQESLPIVVPARPEAGDGLLTDPPRIKWVRCPPHLKETFSTVLVDHLGRFCRGWPRGLTWTALNNVLTYANHFPDVFIFTDGSSRARASGAAIVVQKRGEVLYRGVVTLSSKLESMDMEIIAVNKAFAWLDENKHTLQGNTVCIMSDCKAVLDKIKQGLVATPWLGVQVPTARQLVWIYCPGHARVPGNIMSHTLAHKAANSDWRHYINRSGSLQWMFCPRYVEHLFNTVLIDPSLGPHCRNWRAGNTWRTLYLGVTSITSSPDLLIFTGGSNCFRESGGSMVVMRRGSIIYEAVSSVRPGMLPEDMELMCITTALSWLSYHKRTFTRSVCIFTSNMNLLKKLNAGMMATLWLESALRLRVGHLVWAYCPAHSFVDGNQRAYQLARTAAMGGEYC